MTWISHNMPAPDQASLSLSAAFFRQFLRHGKTLAASPSDLLNPLLFFFMVVTLFPLGLGPDPERLSQMAPGILWVVALLASLMVSGKLFASDFEDGSLEQLCLAPHPLAILALAEVFAHWLGTGFLLALVSPLFAVMVGLPTQALPVLAVSLLLGSLCLTLIGAVGSALTVSIRRGGLLLSLIIIPLHVPVLIFGSSAVVEATRDGNVASWLALLAALALASLALAPLAIGAALRISLDNG
jgi:heme exporter protein B